MRSLPFAITFDISDEYSVEMSLSSNEMRFLKPSTSLVELHPLVHLAELDVADAVVDVLEPDRRRR